MAIRKNSKADLRSTYGIFVEVGMAVALILLILAFRADLQPQNEVDFTPEAQEVIPMEEIPQTEQIQKPPPPPKPPVPVEVPNDEIIEDDDLDLDATLEIEETLATLPPPPAPDEEEDEPEPEIFVVVEEMPCLLPDSGVCDAGDNMPGLIDLGKKSRYPEIARKAGVEGRVIVQFTVDENGNVVEPSVVRGIGAGCDEEALRVLRQAKFKPGKQRGKAVKVRMTLPIAFTLR